MLGPWWELKPGPADKEAIMLTTTLIIILNFICTFIVLTPNIITYKQLNR